MAQRYDVIVVGLGAHGSAALYNLAKWGSRVLGIERWEPGHGNASHHGETRITRQCYAEGEEYVPMLRHSFDAYKALERETTQKLYFKTGVLNMGQPLVDGARASALAHGLPHELLDSKQVAARFPGVRLPQGMPSLFEEEGGILRPEAMVAAHCSVARYHGATLRTDEQVLGWDADAGGGVRVHTDAGSYAGDKLILAAGAWMPKLVPELEGFVQPRRVTVGWFRPRAPDLFSPAALPVWLLQPPGGGPPLYGFPEFGDAPGVKLGAFVGPGVADCDPDAAARGVWRGAEDEAPLRAALRQFFPEAEGEFLKGSACMFAATPDGHFVVDLHPRHPQVVLVSACSGHGFKLSPAVGLAAAELARHGASATFDAQLAIHRLGAARPGGAEVLRRFGACVDAI